MPAVPFMQRLQVVGEQPDETTSRPVLLLDGLRTGLDVSITHTDDTVAAAVAESPCRIGIDLAEVRGVSSGLQSMWMKDYEIHEIRDSEDPDLTSAMNWSAREAAFKASDARDAFRPADWSVTFGTDQIVCSYRGVIQPTRIQFFRLAGGPLLAVATHGGTVPWVVFESPQCTLASQASREDRLNTATIFRDHPHD